MRLLEAAAWLGLLREFQPTVAAAPTWQAGSAAGAAYADVVSGFAALERDELRGAARAVMGVTSGRG